jgi:hypothetical protein
MHSLEYSGTWKVSDGDFVFTITNKTATNLNLADMARAGSTNLVNLERKSVASRLWNS